jgi:hypothetical protein
MEIQEELEEEEECTVVRKHAHAESLNYIEDVAMQSDDGEDKDVSFADSELEADGKFRSEDDEVVAGKKVAPKQRQVCHLSALPA